VRQHWFGSVTDILDHVVPAAAAYMLYRTATRP
jgi:hypothetical protein